VLNVGQQCISDTEDLEILTEKSKQILG